MKTILFSFSILLAANIFAQNMGINSDGSSPEAGVMLDVKATNPKVTTAAVQTLFQIKSFDANTDALKLRLGFKTDATATNRYGFIDFPDFTGGTPAYLNLSLQPSGGNVGIGNVAPAEKLHVTGNIRSSTLGGSGTVLVQADNNGTLGKSSLSGLIPPLVAMDIAHNFDPTIPANNNNHIGIMAAYVPSTGKIWVISTNYTTNTENMDIPSGTPGNEWNPDVGNNMVWVDFGDPNGAGTAYVIALDVAVSTFVTASDECAAVITARMSNGDLYIRSTTPNNLISGAALDVVANWGAWQILVDPGE